MANLSAAAQAQLTILLQLLSVQEQNAIVQALDYTAGSLPAATATQAGAVKRGVAVANGAVPFADLTAAANKVNELLASLRTAGIIAP